jgi:HK97 gp10 family phage protein
MAAIEVVWNGWGALLANFGGITDEVPQKVERIMGEIGEDSKSVMDGYTPVRTGKLKSGNTLDTFANGFMLSNQVEYAKFVEYGTRYMAAQPFLQQAVEYATKNMEERLPEAVQFD